MKCPKCGVEVKPGSVYCHECLQEIQWVSEYNTVETLMEKETKRQMLKRQAKRLEKLQKNRILHLKKIKVKWLAVLVVVVVFACLFWCLNNSYLVQYTLAQNAYNHGQYSRALEYVDSALAVNPDKGKAVVLLSKIVEKQGDLSGAIKVLEGSLDEHKDSQNYYMQLITLYEKAGETDKIKDLILHADDQMIRTNLDYYLCPDPEISLETGIYDEVQKVSIQETEGIRYYYTLDGSQPTTDSTLYQKPISIGEGVTELYVMGENTFGVTSDVLYRRYTIILGVPEEPEISPDSGTYDKDTNITVEVPEGFKAYYAFDEYPSENSTEYKSPVKMPLGEHTFYVILVSLNGKVSDVASRYYYLYEE